MRTTFVTLLLAFLFLLSGFSQAQEQHSISLSYSPISLRGLQYGWKDDTNRRNITIISGEYGYKAVGYDRSYSGVLILSYTYHFNDRVKTGMDIGYENVKRKWDVYENPQGPQTVNQQIHSLYFLPGVGYTYLSRPSLSISSTIQAGMSYMWSDFRYSLSKDKEHYSFAAQVWLFTLQYKLGIASLNCDLGAGSLGFCRIGVGCNF